MPRGSIGSRQQTLTFVPGFCGEKQDNVGFDYTCSTCGGSLNVVCAEIDVPFSVIVPQEFSDSPRSESLILWTQINQDFNSKLKLTDLDLTNLDRRDLILLRQQEDGLRRFLDDAEDFLQSVGAYAEPLPGDLRYVAIMAGMRTLAERAHAHADCEAALDAANARTLHWMKINLILLLFSVFIGIFMGAVLFGPV